MKAQTRLTIVLSFALVAAAGALVFCLPAPQPASAQGGGYITCTVPISNTLTFGLVSCSYSQCTIQSQTGSVIITNTQTLQGIIETVRLYTTDTGWANVSLNGTAITTQTIDTTGTTGTQYTTTTVCVGDPCATLGYSQTAPFAALASSPVTLTHTALAQANADHASFITLEVYDIQAVYTDTGTCAARLAVAYVAPTPTPGATPTAWATPPSGGTYQAQLDATSGLDVSIPTWVTTGIQNIINYITEIDTERKAIANTIDTTLDDAVLTITEYSPFKLMRGFIVMFSDFAWIGTLFAWFVIAFVVILIITVIRLLVSLWGIVQRIIDLIKLIPFI